MSKFYYTYGTDPRYPYQGGWTEIEALDRPSADKLFQMYHPDRTPGILNCADIYNEDEFRRTGMDEDNFGACCTCRFWGLDIDSPVCWKKMQIMNPCEVCGDWERRLAWS